VRRQVSHAGGKSAEPMPGHFRDGTPHNSANARIPAERARQRVEQIGRVNGVIIWKRHDVPCHVAERGVSGPREPQRCAQMTDVDVRADGANYRRKTIIMVLVGDEDFKVGITLCYHGPQEALDRLQPSHSSEDERNARQRCRHPRLKLQNVMRRRAHSSIGGSLKGRALCERGIHHTSDVPKTLSI
jgi:hypothetical protein